MGTRRRCSPRVELPARIFRDRIEAGMLGVNIGVSAPIGYLPFAGWKGSFFGSTQMVWTGSASTPRQGGHDALAELRSCRVVKWQHGGPAVSATAETCVGGRFRRRPAPHSSLLAVLIARLASVSWRSLQTTVRRNRGLNRSSAFSSCVRTYKQEGTGSSPVPPIAPSVHRRRFRSAGVAVDGPAVDVVGRLWPTARARSERCRCADRGSATRHQSALRPRP
jgi:hypothetical protein